jgi:chlorophyllide a oxygenase
MANQVLGEDLRLVVGQQDRLAEGSDTWANPVAYDKLGVRYRRWRNSLDSGMPMAGSLKMSAGELFADEEAAEKR